MSIEEIDAEFRAAGLEPLAPFVSASAERLCRCATCGTGRWVKLNNLKRGGTACRWCYGWDKWGAWGESAREHARAWRDLGTADESLRWLQSVGLAPITPVGDLYQAVGAVCLECGETLVTVPERIKSSTGRGWYACERCAADRKTRVRSDAPALFAAHDLRLLGPCRGEYVPQPARCTVCGADRRVSYDDLRAGREPACWTCTTGIRPDEPHRVYLVHFHDLAVLKIGITHNRDDRRLDEHSAHGGSVVEMVIVPDRESARKLERAIRGIYQDYAVLGVGPSDLPQGGWTETWSDDAPPLHLVALAQAIVRGASAGHI